MTILSQDDLTYENLQLFGEDLHWLRANKGLTLQQAALKLDCSETTLDELERGVNNLDMELVKKLITFYNFKLYLGVNDNDY